ncbi:MAG TPA: hypothetical protein VMM13_13795 [Euzebya sp.]|nr:hypothetical protein [Euzebya sp.]
MNGLPLPLRVAVIVAGVVVIGTLLLAVAHLGVVIPLLSTLGPQGGAVPPAVIAFSVATVLFAAVALGLYRRSRVAWIGAIVLSVAIIAMSLGQYRGIVSGVGIALAAVLIVLLLTPPSRRAVRP